MNRAPQWARDVFELVLEAWKTRPVELERHLLDLGLEDIKARDLLDMDPYVLMVVDKLKVSDRVRLFFHADWTPGWRRAMARVADTIGREVSGCPSTEYGKKVGTACGRQWKRDWRREEWGR